MTKYGFLMHTEIDTDKMKSVWDESLATYEIVIHEFEHDRDQTYTVGAEDFDEAYEIIKSYLSDSDVQYYLKTIKQTGWLILKGWENTPDNGKISP